MSFGPVPNDNVESANVLVTPPVCLILTPDEAQVLVDFVPIPNTGALVPKGNVTSAPFCGHGNADVK